MQLFSNTTAQAIRYVMPGEEHVADFFQLVNDSFDILNSRRRHDKKLLGCGYGTCLDTQERILRQMYECCEKMKAGKSRHLLPFQKGFMMTIRSLFCLYSDLQNLDVKYILTSRLNQDCLENLFSQIRGIGHFYLNPSPTEVKFRLRLLLLGRNANDIPLSNRSPVEQEEGQEFLTSRLLHGILPDMSEPLAMIEGETEIQDINLEFNSETEISPITGGIDCSVEGFRYLAGYIAHRGMKYDRTMGTPSELNLPSTSASEHGSWIEVLSRGGLIVPSDD